MGSHDPLPNRATDCQVNGIQSSALPFTVLGGFLGSGKTTLLNRLLTTTKETRYAVLVNDFGELNIDERLIAAHDGETIALANGCVLLYGRWIYQRIDHSYGPSDSVRPHGYRGKWRVTPWAYHGYRKIGSRPITQRGYRID